MNHSCDICAKGRTVGFRVSHANNRTKKPVWPNIQSMRVFDDHGHRVSISACTRCIRTGLKNGTLRKAPQGVKAATA